MRLGDIIAHFIAADLHSHLFFEEFTFARTQFTPPGASEIELADAVVLLGDTLLIFQIKERAPDKVGDDESERKWFASKVLKQAIKQINDTLRFLQSHATINVPNERGRMFNLAAQEYPEIVKIVLYASPPILPEACRLTKHYVSSKAGFIHVVDAEAYARYAQLLRVPEEIVRYFRYREAMLTRFPDECVACTEADLVGSFIVGDEDVPPVVGAAGMLPRLVRDEDDWDLTPLLRGLHDHISVPGVSDDYYGILREFARLPRSMWKEAKLRIRLCIELARKGEFARPYRFSDPASDCGFVFVPVMPEISTAPDWREIRTNAVKNFTLAHKYDQRLRRCVGVMVAWDEPHFDIQWCLADFPWVEDQELESRLSASFPFRPVSEEIRFSFFLHDGIRATHSLADTGSDDPDGAHA
jgi:hypothetical protein